MIIPALGLTTGTNGEYLTVNGGQVRLGVGFRDSACTSSCRGCVLGIVGLSTCRLMLEVCRSFLFDLATNADFEYQSS